MKRLFHMVLLQNLQLMTKYIFLLFFFFTYIFASNAISIDGDIKYKNLKYFNYVNPNAPKGGKIKGYSIGTFDTLNQFVIKGNKAEGLELLYDTLMVQSKDEPFSQYGLIASDIKLGSNYVIFTINKNAKFNDGVQVKPSDVKFSFEVLMKYGNPLIKQYYLDVDNVELVDDNKVKFNFKTSQNKELPLILGQLSIIPEHFYKDIKFDENPLLIPLGSGPYRIKSFEVGRSIAYERVDNYWAIDHPTRIGQFNFDEISYTYYKDENVALEAFKSGEYDFRLENSAKVWVNGYNGKGKKEGLLKQVSFKHFLPSGMQGFFLNTKRSFFDDIMVRKALLYAFDFNWSNRNLFFNQYTRTKSFFDNSIFASDGIPSGLERDILKKLKIGNEILNSKFYLPSYNNIQDKRLGLLYAQSLLQKAGFESINHKLYKDNKQFKFEILLVSKAMERVVLPFIENLKMLGIEASVRTMDIGSYVNRLNDFDYDVIVAVIPQSLFPGNEQRYFWSSKSANTNGSKNYARIESSNIDFLIENIINAKSKDEQIAYTKALDRLLLWGYYVIPHFYSNYFRVAYWDKFKYPQVSPLYDFDIWTWWAK